MQLVDFTTLTAACDELRAEWLPARLEQVYQRDRFTIQLALRTLKQRGWLTICWHPQAARVCIGDPPPRTPDTFTFSDQLRHQLSGLALVAIEAIAPWERVLDLQFAKRPGDPAIWHLYVEIMGKYSNVILTGADNVIVTVAHQVTAQQSSVRPVLTGQPYELPPALTQTTPTLSESIGRWRERISLIPGNLGRNILKNYRGLSSPLVTLMVQTANLNPDQSTDSLSETDWQQLFSKWQEWLHVLGKAGDLETRGRGDAGTRRLEIDTEDKADANSIQNSPPVNSHQSTVISQQSPDTHSFVPGFTAQGYTVLGWGIVEPTPNVQTLLNVYYTNCLNRQEFAQLRHQLNQKISSNLAKLRLKAQTFEQRLQQSDEADTYRQQADLLMAHLQNWEPGMKAIALPDFETGLPVNIPLDPERNAVQNAQALYKRHQKLKRARDAVEPLLAEVKAEINYLEQVESTLAQLDEYSVSEDLQTLEEIREELIAQGYLEAPEQRSRNDSDESMPYSYRSPSGFELLIGRNNKQNDKLTFRLAGDYDLWFHTQEIPGSHALLRLEPGSAPDDADLQFAADLTAYYSRARQSDQVPVVYTEPKYVYKPKGTKPGMVVYKQEKIIWGRPQQGRTYLK